MQLHEPFPLTAHVLDAGDLLLCLVPLHLPQPHPAVELHLHLHIVRILPDRLCGGRLLLTLLGLGLLLLPGGLEAEQRDATLPCGLRQEEVIDIMYRDIRPEDFDMLCKLDEGLPRRNTAQQSLVDRLPLLPARGCGEADCGICLQALAQSTRAARLPCQHLFHPACISRWLTQCKSACPLCSAVIGDGAVA
mmetsp:Transcript_89138/g.279211  ORF Transcript_89138/g.279211 Transcript_89138/m.279211 type:complete len:192 (+) Transcript_89138:1191-1766(+)